MNDDVVVAEKSLTPEAVAATVQQPPPGQGPFSTSPLAQVLYLAGMAEEIEPWGRNVKLRDTQLRDLMPIEPYFLSALASVCARNAAFPWKLKGPDAAVKQAQTLLKTANFGRGWEDLILRISLDLYTQDNGAVGEIIRAYDSPEAPVIGIASLDSGRCYHTGLEETPILYLDRANRYHLLKWYQVFTITELPTNIESLPGLQYSALTRLLRKLRTNRDIQTYLGEKVGGRSMRAVTAVRGLSAEQIMDAWQSAQFINDSAGLTRFSNPLFVSSLSPEAEIDFKTFEIASIPDGFDLDVEMKWYIALIALAFLSDYQEFAPLPGGGLGTASQSETQDKKTKGKGPAIFRSKISQALNWLILPQTVEFEFEEIDLGERNTEATGKKLRAEERSIRIASGELTPEVARTLAMDEGDLTADQFDALERQAAEMQAQQGEAARQIAAQASAEQTLDDGGKPTAQLGKDDDVVSSDEKVVRPAASRISVEALVEESINAAFDDLYDLLKSRSEMPEGDDAV